MTKYFLLISFLISIISKGQTVDRWAQVVGWDGISHWSRYMITQPAFQGPNALPVPAIGNGTIDSITYIGVTGDLHFSPGDNTQNIGLHANYNLVKNRVAVNITWIPFEYYTLSETIQNERHVFTEFYNDHSTVGDVYLDMNFQLLNKLRKHIHLTLRVGYRFPTGSDFGAARYVDGPGYFFDISYGKPIKNTNLKWIGMLGFYVWQIESDSHNQNDAFLFGSGLEWNKEKIMIEASINGYLGWMYRGGDKPIVFRTNLEKKMNRFTLILGFQQGLNDFKYSSIRVGTNYHFSRSLK